MSRTKILYTNILGFVFGVAAFIGVLYGMSYLMVWLNEVPRLFVTDTAITVKRVIDLILVAGGSSYIAYLICNGICQPTLKWASPGVIAFGILLVCVAGSMVLMPNLLPTSKMILVVSEWPLWVYAAVIGAFGLFIIGDGLPSRRKMKSKKMPEPNSVVASQQVPSTPQPLPVAPTVQQQMPEQPVPPQPQQDLTQNKQ